MPINGMNPEELRTRLKLMQLSNRPWSEVSMIDPAETQRQLQELSQQPWEDVRMKVEPHPLRGVLPEWIKRKMPGQFPEYAVEETQETPVVEGAGASAPMVPSHDADTPVGAAPPDPVINIEGLTVDQDTGDVVDTQDPEQRMMSIAVPADQGPIPIQQQLINKLDLIRAQAAMKGREGSLQSAEGAQPLSSDWQGEKEQYGTFSQSTMTPEIQKRIDDNMMFAAESDENFASWMLQTPEIRERMKTDPSAIAEALRTLSTQKKEDARRALGMRIMELTKNESGLMSPQDASGYEILMGEKPPAGAVGIDRMQASQQIYNMRMSIDKMITQATQGLYGGDQVDIFRNYGRLATQLFAKADQQLQANADPTMVIARLQAELASLQAPAGNTTDDLSTRGTDPTQPYGVAKIGD